MFYVTKTGDVRYPSSLITFAGARGGDVRGTGYWSNGTQAANSATVRDGFYKVTPPAPVPFSTSVDHPGPGPGPGYSMVNGWSAPATTVTYDPRQPPSAYGYLNARYFKTVAVAKVDASATRMTIAELRNMKYWDNFVDVNTNPTTGVYTWRPRP
jgi:hypothetical protein